MSSKGEIREEMGGLLADLSWKERRRASEKLCAKIESSFEFQGADALFAFYPFKGEIDILPLLRKALEQDKALCLPRIEGKEMVFRRVDSLDRSELVTNRWGIAEPSARCPEKDSGNFARPVMLVPGTAFSTEGKRLGRGGGYYDRYLEAPHRFLLIGVGFSCQLRENLPTETHDIMMDRVYL